MTCGRECDRGMRSSYTVVAAIKNIHDCSTHGLVMPRTPVTPRRVRNPFAARNSDASGLGSLVNLSGRTHHRGTEKRAYPITAPVMPSGALGVDL